MDYEGHVPVDDELSSDSSIHNSSSFTEGGDEPSLEQVAITHLSSPRAYKAMHDSNLSQDEGLVGSSEFLSISAIMHRAKPIWCFCLVLIRLPFNKITYNGFHWTLQHEHDTSFETTMVYTEDDDLEGAEDDDEEAVSPSAVQKMEIRNKEFEVR